MTNIVVPGSNNDNRFAVIDFTLPASPVKALVTPPFQGGCIAYGPPPETSEHHRHPGHHEATGKISGVVYDRFGDFEGFCLLTEEGHERCYRSCEADVEALVRYAWAERIVVTVIALAHQSEQPAKIILRRTPPQPHCHPC